VAAESDRSPVVLLTGASSGIGLALASRLAESRHQLILPVHGPLEKLEAALADRPCPDPYIRTLDVTDRGAVGDLVQTAESRFGGIDALVTCAGIYRGGSSLSFGWDDWDEVFRVNVDGTFAVIKAALPGLVKRGSGRILTCASELALTGAPEATAYAASKGAIISMTKCLARELAPAGILVNCVAPGPTATPMLLAESSYADGSEAERLPLGRYGRSDEIAAMFEALLGEPGEYVVGQVISPNGGAVI